MQQKKESNHLEVISMEEYLTRRQKIRESDLGSKRKRTDKERPAWMSVELYV